MLHRLSVTPFRCRLPVIIVREGKKKYIYIFEDLLWFYIQGFPDKLISFLFFFGSAFGLR